MLVIYTFLKEVHQNTKKSILYVRIISDHSCNDSGHQNELAQRLNLGKTAEFLQAVVFVLCETPMCVIMYVVEVKAVRNETQPIARLRWERRNHVKIDNCSAALFTGH